MEQTPDKVYEEVKQAYLAEVEMPARKPSNQYILCPIGLVGAGKTTVMKPLAKRLNLVRLSGDEIRKHFKERGYGYDRFKELTYDITAEFLARGHSIGIDSDCIGEDTKQKLAEAQAKFDLKLVWIHINPPEEFIINKLSQLTPNWLGTAEQMVANYHLRKPLHEKLDFDFTFTFDTSRPDLPQQLVAGERAIREAVGLEKGR